MTQRYPLRVKQKEEGPVEYLFGMVWLPQTQLFVPQNSGVSDYGDISHCLHLSLFI